MNTNITELNMNEMETVSGGWNWSNFFAGAITGGGLGATPVGGIALVASGPVGWCFLGGAAVGAAAVGIYNGTQD